jgi:hypothetical protein
VDTSLMSLWRELANELASWCHTSTADDYKKLVCRVKAEGLSFLTITLPQYSKDFERSLEVGSVGGDLFSGFVRRGGLPLFLGGFLRQVFDASGTILDVPSTDCILAIRQLTTMFAKIEIACSEERRDRAVQKYLECERDLERVESCTSAEMKSSFRRMARLLWADAFQCVDEDVYYLNLIPKHGPGATADRLVGNAKFNQREWTYRLERSFPYVDYCLPSWRTNDQHEPTRFLEPGAERPVKVITVPKTLKTPRIIAIEPTCMQYAQQAVSQRLVEVLEKDGCRHPAGRRHWFRFDGFVGFEKQEVNRLLALEGSIHCRLATLDLSEASDRVLNGHVELLFDGFPHLGAAIQDSRSLKARVPAHFNRPETIIGLRKFASMGSALCFPVEALVFATIIFTALEHDLNRPLTREDINSFRGKVRVYGDDIIVPVDHVETVIRYLEAFGLRVNSDKSFWNGKFRESCGGDYYAGEWVTPVRVRRLFPRKLSDAQEVVSLVSFRNQLYMAGFWMTARWIDDNYLSSLMRGAWNIVDPTCADLGRFSVAFGYRQQGYFPQTHAPAVRGVRVRRKTPDSPLDGLGALLKFFIKQGDEPSQDERHLERQGRSRVVGIKRGWIRPY